MEKIRGEKSWFDDHVSNEVTMTMDSRSTEPVVENVVNLEKSEAIDNYPLTVADGSRKPVTHSSRVSIMLPDQIIPLQNVYFTSTLQVNA